MFEEIIQRREQNKVAKKRTKLLLSKYLTLKRYQELQLQKQHQQKGNGKAKRKVNEQVNPRLLEFIHAELERHLKPDETYEIWHELPSVNANLKKQQGQEKPENAPSPLTGGDHGISEDDDDNNVKVAELINDLFQAFDKSKNFVKANILLTINGLEVLPLPKKNEGQIHNHINNLKTLLQLNLLRKNWSLAYKIYCTLIRFPIVDIKAIWSIGIEILIQQRKLEEQHQQEQKHTLFKDERFFDWLITFFPLNRFDASKYDGKGTIRVTSAPIWRMGTLTASPLYLITALWNLLINRKFQALKSKLSELMLEPPYNDDGAIYFLMSLTFIFESFELIEESNNRGDDKSFLKSELSTIHAQIVMYLNKCDQLNFKYPSVIGDQVTILTRYIEGNEDKKRRSFSVTDSSDFDDEDEDDSNSNNATMLKTDKEAASEIAFFDSDEEDSDDDEDDPQQPSNKSDDNNVSNDYDNNDDGSNGLVKKEKAKNQNDMDFDFDFDFE